MNVKLVQDFDHGMVDDIVHLTVPSPEIYNCYTNRVCQPQAPSQRNTKASLEQALRFRPAARYERPEA
jgi:hypothetical protein